LRFTIPIKNLYKVIYRFTIVLLAIVYVGNVASQNLLIPDTVRSCRVDSIFFDAGPGFDTYIWSNGDTTQTTWISESGNYFLHVTQGDTVDIIEDFVVVIVDARLLQNNISIVCGDTITLAGDNSFYDYFWTPGGLMADTILVFPRDTVYYIANISDPGDPAIYCIDTVLISVEPVISIDTVIQSSIGCPGEDKAKIQLGVSGGYPPYLFEWPPEAIPLFEDPSFAIGLTDGMKTIMITDTIGCFLHQEFEVKAHPIPELILEADPSDTVYLQKPFVTFSFENPQYDSLGVDTLRVSWWEWDFGDNTQSLFLNPTHTYQNAGTYNVVLNYRTFYECEGSDSITIQVKPVRLKLPTVITPNGDTYNDFFEIWEDTGNGTGSGTDLKSIGSSDQINLDDFYMSNTLIIFNRWGEKVYEVNNYQNDWNGDGLQDGVYFYILQCIGFHQNDVYKGSFMILTDQTF
jgi:PKD repeat protein